MRYHPLDPRETPGDTVAAVWPSIRDALNNRQALDLDADKADVAPAPVPPIPTAPDVPDAVGGFVVASCIGLLIVFFTFFSGSAEAFLAIAICAVFMAVLFAVEPAPTRRARLSKLMRGGIQTLTGHSKGGDVSIRKMIVPVFVGFGLMTMGIIAMVPG